MPKAIDDHSTTRRMMMAGGASLTALAMAAKAVAAPVPAGPDAELIAACEAYMRALRAYNAGDLGMPAGLSGAEEDLFCDEAYERIAALERHTETFAAQTIEGVHAEAKVAMDVAQNPDGSTSFDGGQGSEWAERVVRSLLRVRGETV